MTRLTDPIEETFSQVRIWRQVAAHIEDAAGIAWDGCHKIYLLMDQNQVTIEQDYGNERILTRKTATDEEMTKQVKSWFSQSCSLRFIQAVTSIEDSYDDKYEDIIPQFSEDFEEDFDSEEVE